MSERGVAIITGGSRGIGRATAIKLASMGYDVVISYRHRKDAALDVIKTIREYGVSARAVKGDVARKDVARRVISTALDMGTLTLVVNNAGVYHPLPLDRIQIDIALDMVDTNFRAVVLMTALALRNMSMGAIVNVASIVGLDPWPGMSVYSATKAAVIHLTRAVAREVDGIRIVCVAPGPTATDMLARYHSTLGADRPEKVAERIVWAAEKGKSGECYTVE